MAFSTETEIVVRYVETDRMGVVYHANYLVWMEVGRSDFLAGLGFPYSELEKNGILFPTSNASFKIFRPSYYEDRLTVLTRIARLQSRKVVFSYDVRREEEMIVSGTTEHICTDEGMKVKKMPQPLFEVLGRSMSDDGKDVS